MTKYTRIAWAVACATLLATPALGLGASATMRVEGATSTLIPRHQANIPPAGSTTLLADSFDSDTISVRSDSATALLVRMLADANVQVGFDVFNFGEGPSTFITRIGPDAMPASYSPFWKIKVNHKTASVGSDGITLAAGDDVLWAFVGDYGDGELALSGPSTPLPVGTPFAVTVATYDNNAARAPGAGATVSYGDQRVTADASGTATLTSALGVQTITAEAPRASRDSARACGYPAANPEVCALAPLVLTLPDVTVRVTVRVTATLPSGRVVVANLAVPTRGSAPVSINPADVDAPGATRRERRLAAGKLASALAFQINARADNGDAAVTPPSGTRWRAVWLRGAATVAPLGPREKLLGMRRSTTAATVIMRGITQGAADALRACDIKGHALTVQRFGYAMAVVTSPGVGTRECIDAAAR